MFTEATLAAFLLANHCVPPKLVDLVVGIALTENPALDENFVSEPNKNRTRDYGILHVNTINFGWTNVNHVTVFDPCKNAAAGLKVWFVRYNGNPPDVLKVAYADRTWRNMEKQSHPDPPAKPADPPAPPHNLIQIQPDQLNRREQ